MKMTTRFAKTAIVTASTIAIIAILLAYPALSTASAQTSTSASSTTGSPTGTAYPPWSDGFGFPPNQGGDRGMGGPGFGQPQSKVTVPVGQTITFTSTSGQYVVVGTTSTNGTASGSLVFTVSNNLAEGYTLSITGSVVVGGTTYTISSGSAIMSPSATSMTGQGATSPTGAFILQGASRGSFVGTTASISLDLKSGSTEYMVLLNGTVQG
ncbi:MAG: hypothetical protein ABSG45_05380 [Nitrososphaerales archaeon]